MGPNEPFSVCEAETSYIVATTAHERNATAHKRSVTSHKSTVATRASTSTSRTHPLEPSETAYENIAKPFLLFERVLVLSDPHGLLKDLLRGARNLKHAKWSEAIALRRIELRFAERSEVFCKFSKRMKDFPSSARIFFKFFHTRDQVLCLVHMRLKYPTYRLSLSTKELQLPTQGL